MKSLPYALNVEEIAGRMNARLLRYREDPNSVLLSLLRSGLGLASTLSGLLHLPRHIFIVEHLRAPCTCPCAIGALTETNHVFMDERVIARQQWPYRNLRAYIEREMQTQRADIVRQQNIYRMKYGLPDLGGRNVIFVNDGTAVSASLIASIESFRELGAARIVMAVASDSIQFVKDIQYRVDEFIVVDPAKRHLELRQAELSPFMTPPRVA